MENRSKFNLLTVKDLQDKMHIGRDTSYILMRSKSFPSIKLGTRYYVTEEALIQWLDANKYRSISI